MRPQAIPVDQAFDQSEEQFNAIKLRLSSQEALGLSHSELERTLHREGMELLRRLMQDYLSLRAVQEQEQGLDRPVIGADQVERTHQRPGDVRLMTSFGPVRVERISYGQEGVASLKPLEAQLNVPQDSYSHEVRRRVALEVCRGSYDEAVEALHQSTGAHVPKRQTQELAEQAAQDFDAFYQRRAVPEPQVGTEDDLVVLSADGKGVVMRAEALLAATRRAAELKGHKMRKRLSKGEKKDRKRMATVAAVYTVAPQCRTPEDIMAELAPVHLVGEEQERPQPQDKRVWASVVKKPEQMMREAFEEGLRRDPDRERTWVALSDGNKQQLKLFKKLAKEYGIKLTVILDIIHVVQYLWKATTVFNLESSPEAEQWVEQRFVEVLRGRASHVAAGMRRSATKRALKPEQRKAADKCAGYLLKYAQYMRYADYLDQGFPIATGVIEGGCRYLVKDRMDITGARWGLEGAEAVLRLRALRSSGDFDEYWTFHEACEYERNHSQLYAEQEVPQVCVPSTRLRSNRSHLRLVD
jgi:hypothetical protein